MINCLLIEDDRAFAQLLKRMLSNRYSDEITITHAESMAMGINLLESHRKFDVIISDLHLRHYTEVETLEIIEQYTTDYPVIIVSISPFEELGRKAMKIGAEDYFMKGDFTASLLYRSIIHAITRRELAQRAKKYGDISAIDNQYENLFSVKMRNTKIVFWEYDCEKNIFTHISQGALNFSGFATNEWLDHGFLDAVVHPDDLLIVINAFQNSLLNRVNGNGNVINEIQFRFKHAGGTYLWVNLIIHVRNKDLKILNGFFTDVTKPMEQIKALEMENRWLKSCVSLHTSAIIAVDKNREVVIINKKAQLLLNVTKDKAIGANINTIIPSSFHNTYSVGGINYKILHTSGGEKIPVLLEIQKLFNEHNETSGVIYMFYDIRKILKTEGKIVQQLQRTKRELNKLKHSGQVNFNH
jgi:CheY-like chemotaxis protein